MEHVNPVQITPDQWHTLYVITMLFFTLVVVGAVGAFSFGLAHGIIPSLTLTREASTRLISLRPIFYAGAIVFLLGALAIIAYGISLLGVTWEIYPVHWI
jgi:hypothetical protein